MSCLLKLCCCLIFLFCVHMCVCVCCMHTDPTKDVTIKIEGKDVTVPQGTPLQQPKWQGSNFSQSEYLVYKESQARLRYLLKIQFWALAHCLWCVYVFCFVLPLCCVRATYHHIARSLLQWIILRAWSEQWTHSFLRTTQHKAGGCFFFSFTGPQKPMACFPFSLAKPMIVVFSACWSQLFFCFLNVKIYPFSVSFFCFHICLFCQHLWQLVDNFGLFTVPLCTHKKPNYVKNCWCFMPSGNWFVTF